MDSNDSTTDVYSPTVASVTDDIVTFTQTVSETATFTTGGDATVPENDTLSTDVDVTSTTEPPISLEDSNDSNDDIIAGFGVMEVGFFGAAAFVFIVVFIISLCVCCWFICSHCKKKRKRTSKGKEFASSITVVMVISTMMLTPSGP